MDRFGIGGYSQKELIRSWIFVFIIVLLLFVVVGLALNPLIYPLEGGGFSSGGGASRGF